LVRERPYKIKYLSKKAEKAYALLYAKGYRFHITYRALSSLWELDYMESRRLRTGLRYLVKIGALSRSKGGYFIYVPKEDRYVEK